MNRIRKRKAAIVAKAMETAAVIEEGLRVAGRLAGAVGGAAAEAVFPAKCLACGDLIGSEAPAGDGAAGANRTGGGSWQILAPFTCRSCGAGIRAVRSPICECCGRLFASREGEDRICEGCIRAPNHFRAARSALVYTDACASLVRALKYHGKMQLAGPFGMILRRSFETFWPRNDFDRIVPVPLHRRRLKARGFNQVGLMMRQWRRSLHKEALPPACALFSSDILERVLPTRPQTGLNRKERSLNLRNAFGLQSGADISGMKLLLLDDVYTTGATVNEAARVLMAQGAQRVDVLTLARAI